MEPAPHALASSARGQYLRIDVVTTHRRNLPVLVATVAVACALTAAWFWLGQAEARQSAERTERDARQASLRLSDFVTARLVAVESIRRIREAGLMDGLSRLAVIWKIPLPLALPALASVSLYVFMIAWNEFLLAFMLLDDPSKFTLTRGIASLNSSEIPRQHLMAGAVIATVPIMALFLGLERFMTKGLTAGSVKG